MNLWLNNRFSDRGDIPPQSWHRATLGAVAEYPEGGPACAIFLFDYEDMGQPFRAGLVVHCNYSNHIFRELVIALLGRLPRQGRRLKSSEVMNKALEILPTARYSEKLKGWYIGIAAFRKADGGLYEQSQVQILGGVIDGNHDRHRH